MTTYTDRPWLKRYDSFVPHTLLPHPDVPLHHFLQETARQHPDNTALITTVKLPVLGRQTSRYTYRQLNEQSDALAAALVEMGLKKGDKVALVMPNCVSFVIAYFGISKAGGVVAATNPTYPADKMAYQLNDCDAEIVISLTMFYSLLNQIRGQTKVKHVILSNIKEYFTSPAKFLFTLAAEKKGGHRIDGLRPGDYWLQDMLERYKGRSVKVDLHGRDQALFQYTGGTTGISKGAIASHGSLVANVRMMQHWTGIAQFGEVNGHRTSEMIYLGAIPMFHSYGLIAMLIQGISSGSSIILIPNPRDIDEVVDIIHHYKPNAFLGVPALFNAISNHRRILSHDVSLKCFELNVSGSASLPVTTKRQYEQLSESVIIEGFGMSETPVATHANPFKGEHKGKSIGLPYPDVDCRIVSLDDPLMDVPVGDVGELVITGPNLMTGYHKMPTETTNMMREQDGKVWLYTGDIAYMDEEGYFYIVDRKKDMALIGGYNVYPSTIEDVVKSHPAVLEVGVAAIPHPEKEGQETLKAWIVLKPDMKATEKEIIDHCSAKLAPYEVPRRIAFIAELPKTTIGKTLRRELVRLEVETR